MTQSTNRPKGTALRAVPRLAFEIRRVMGTVTSEGFGPGYTSTEVHVMSTAALELQRELGVEPFVVVLTLAMAGREEADGSLVVDTPTPLLMKQTGWGREKVYRIVGQLEAAGFLQRGTVGRTVRDDGRTGFGRTRIILSPALYTTVEERVTRTRTLSGVAPTGVAEPDTTHLASAAGFSDTTPSAVGEPDTRDEAAGHTGAGFSGTSGPGHSHVDGDDYEHLHQPDHDDEAHVVRGPVRLAASDGDLAEMLPFTRPLPAHLEAAAPTVVGSAAAAPTPEHVHVQQSRRLTRDQLVSLLKSWRVMDATKIVDTTPNQLLHDAVTTVISRLEERKVRNPGGYLRTLIQEGLRTGSVPTPLAPPAVTPLRSDPEPARRAPVPAPSVEADPEVVPPAVLEEVLNRLDPAVRERLEQAAQQAVDAAPWVKGPGTAAGLRQATLASLLREGGHLD